MFGLVLLKLFLCFGFVIGFGLVLHEIYWYKVDEIWQSQKMSSTTPFWGAEFYNRIQNYFLANYLKKSRNKIFRLLHIIKKKIIWTLNFESPLKMRTSISHIHKAMSTPAKGACAGFWLAVKSAEQECEWTCSQKGWHKILVHFYKKPDRMYFVIARGVCFTFA